MLIYSQRSYSPMTHLWNIQIPWRKLRWLIPTRFDPTDRTIRVIIWDRDLGSIPDILSICIGIRSFVVIAIIDEGSIVAVVVEPVEPIDWDGSWEKDSVGNHETPLTPAPLWRLDWRNSSLEHVHGHQVDNHDPTGTGEEL
jgi:hypothetical protein